MITINNMPSPYGRDGRLLTHEEYQKKCELIDKANREVKEFTKTMKKLLWI